MTVWQSQQAWQIHRVASSCLLSGHTQVSWPSPWHQTQWAVLPARLLGFWVALAESGCFFSGLLCRETAWWFCALKCQGKGLLCYSGSMAKPRAGQRDLPSSLNALAENPGQPEVGAFPSCQPAQSSWPRIRILIPHLIQPLSCLESEHPVLRFLLPEVEQAANRIY